MGTGFRCPKCGSYHTVWIPFSMDVKCLCCGNVFDPEEEEQED